jgi:hypothetical protein
MGTVHWKDQETINQEQIEAAWNRVRSQRDRLLSATDWTMTADAPLTTTQVDEAKTYRQALRDLPQDHSDPDAVVWPAKPAFVE